MTQPIDDQLRSFRASIDNIDAALVHLLAERFKITQAVGRHKAEVGLPAMDPEREAEQVARLRALAAESGLDPAFTEAFLRFILDEVIRHHERDALGDCDRTPRISAGDASDRGEEASQRVEAHAAELQRLGVERLGVEVVAVAGSRRVATVDPDPLADLVARRLARPAEVAVDLVGASAWAR